ncbi:Oidioi.mRNA.OKI2018_I69.chr2.g7709.t1.cds [Oikopleura dioica]|uniref:Oidioi.mRNA.OKI2018_I69.chr2.g7709.t1.cds n=1 Tax=Oikopleura dioica TaxID=34765 RepID=A0ABN7T825_OIKDI|nr:Oidioi.mRNA.OKI2018_I69.chr2.g7709.t1.cds [Oikopleura dioica]
MNTPRTSGNDFSKKSRVKLNERFSRLRVIVEKRFPEIHDWNRFRILDAAIALLGGKPLSANPTERRTAMNNQEACAYYRNKLKNCFEILKQTLDTEGFISAGTTRQLNTRAGLLEFTIDCLVTKFGEPDELRIDFLPTPIVRRSPKKRRSTDSCEFTPPAKRPSSINFTPSPASSSSGSLQLSPEHEQLLQKLRIAYFLSNLSGKTAFNPALDLNIWRPW